MNDKGEIIKRIKEVLEECEDVELLYLIEGLLREGAS